MRCPHCASGDIGTALPLSVVDLAGVYAATAVRVEGPRLISLSGIGECSLNERAVTCFARNIAAGPDEVRFTFTTVGTRPGFVDTVNALAPEIPVKLLQISLFHHDDIVVKTMMGRAFARYDIADLIARVLASENIHVRFNIVLMSGFNDSTEVWEGLYRRLTGLEKRVSIRMSQLNETNVSRGSGLRPTAPARVIEAATWFVHHGFDAYPFMSSYNDDMNCGQLIWNYRQLQNVAA
jgi:adenine C2-methylase RlmN of 23S rRNA A2503 and tRNA A37